MLWRTAMYVFGGLYAKVAWHFIYMHMADALVSPVTGMAFNAISAAAVAASSVKMNRAPDVEKKIPLIGVAGALVFAGQMINFAIPGTGSSGHIGGGVLLCGLLGGVPAFLSMCAVIIIQCLFFADGGLLAVGCNIFNLGVIPCLVVYPLVFKPIVKKGINSKRLAAASIVSAVVALELGALGVTLQTLASGIAQLPFGLFASFMLPIHFVIGCVEGVVTAAVINFIYKAQPGLVGGAALAIIPSGDNPGAPQKARPQKIAIIAIGVAALAIAGALSLLASTKPDGLEWAIGKTVGMSTGAESAETETAETETAKAETAKAETAKAGTAKAVETSASGMVGAAAVFALACMAGFAITMVKKRNKSGTHA